MSKKPSCLWATLAPVCCRSVPGDTKYSVNAITFNQRKMSVLISQEINCTTRSYAIEMTNIITKRHNELQVERTGRAAGQLSRFHHKGPVASKFAEVNLMDYPVWGAMLEDHFKLKTTPKPWPKSRKRFRLSAETCHKDRSTRLWKTS